MMEAISQFNFLDILILIIVFRICYIAFEMGLAVEFFKLSGILFTTYISLHYYTTFSDILQRWFFPKGMPLEFLDFLVFIFLASSAYLGFVVLRSIFYRFMRLEALPNINRFGGLILGIARSFFVIGLMIYILLISSVNYLSNSVKHSYLGSKIAYVSPQTYGWIWNNIISKFSSNEKFNPTVNEVLERLKKK